MTERLLRTGVALRLPSSHPGEEDLQSSRPASNQVKAVPDQVEVEIQVFADLQDERGTHRVAGPVDGATVDRTADPTTGLIHLAQEARDLHLGDLLGDVRIRGCNVTRFELYFVPFHIELSSELNDEFARVWNGRRPSLQGGALHLAR